MDMIPEGAEVILILHIRGLRFLKDTYYCDYYVSQIKVFHEKENYHILNDYMIDDDDETQLFENEIIDEEIIETSYQKKQRKETLLKELQEKRDLAMKQQQENGPIMMHKEGGEPVPITNKQAVEIIMQKDQQLKQLVEAFKEKEDAVTELNEKYQKSVIENRNLNNKMSLLEEKIALLTKLSENYENNSSTIST